MPCRDDGPRYPDTDELGATIDDLSQMLCYVLTRIGAGDTLPTVLGENHALMDWWNRHLRADVRREAAAQSAREQAAFKMAALNKLTPTERAALGLNETFRH